MDNELMDVCFGGEIVKRPISHIEAIEGHLSRVVPKLQDGEECIWYMGSLIPHIIQARQSSYRASQACICDRCGKQYGDHPMDESELSWQNEPFLHVLCNGDRVKL